MLIMLMFMDMPDSLWIRLLVGTVSDNLWRVFCSQCTDAFSAFEALDYALYKLTFLFHDDVLYKSTFYLLTYLQFACCWTLQSSVGFPGWRLAHCCKAEKCLALLLPRAWTLFSATLPRAAEMLLQLLSFLVQGPWASVTLKVRIGNEEKIY